MIVLRLLICRLGFAALTVLPTLATATAAWKPPTGYRVPASTMSPDGTLGVLVPDRDHLEEGVPQNALVNVRTGETLAVINAGTYWEGPDEISGDLTLTAAWSEDGSVLAWSISSGWFPAAWVLIKVEDGAVAWQTDVYSRALRVMLDEVAAAAPDAFSAVRVQNKDNGSGFVDGFAVNIAAPEPGFSLPYEGQVTADSNVKNLTENWPAAANLFATMSFSVSDEGTLAFSDFALDAGKTGVARTEDGGDDAPTPSASDGGFSEDEVNDAVRTWVLDFIDREAKNDVDGLVGMYWSEVDYLGEGTVDPDHIRTDKAAFFKQWPKRTVKLTGDITVKSRGDDTNWTVTYPTRVTLRNSRGETRTMDARNSLTVTLAGETYAISAQHVKVSSEKSAEKSTGAADIDASALLGAWEGDKILTFFKNGTFGVQKYEGAPIDRKGRKWSVAGSTITWTTPDGTWDETIVSVSPRKLVIRDEDGNESTYTR